jgi:hypothetical protein
VTLALLPPPLPAVVEPSVVEPSVVEPSVVEPSVVATLPAIEPSVPTAPSVDPLALALLLGVVALAAEVVAPPVPSENS